MSALREALRRLDRTTVAGLTVAAAEHRDALALCGEDDFAAVWNALAMEAAEVAADLEVERVDWQAAMIEAFGVRILPTDPLEDDQIV